MKSKLSESSEVARLKAQLSALQGSLAKAESEASAVKESLLIRDGEISHLRRRLEKTTSSAAEAEQKHKAAKMALEEQIQKIEKDFEAERNALHSKAAFQRQSIETSVPRNLFPPSTRRRQTRPSSPTKAKFNKVFDDSPLSIRPTKRSPKKENPPPAPPSISAFGFQNTFALSGTRKVTSTQGRQVDMGRARSRIPEEEDVFGSRQMGELEIDEGFQNMNETPDRSTPFKWKGKEKAWDTAAPETPFAQPHEAQDVEMTEYDYDVNPIEKTEEQGNEEDDREPQAIALTRRLFSHVSISPSTSLNRPLLTSTLRYLASLTVPGHLRTIYQERCEALFTALSRAQFGVKTEGADELTLIAEVAASLEGLIESLIRVVEQEKDALEALRISLNLVAFISLTSPPFSLSLLRHPEYTSPLSAAPSFLHVLSRVILTVAFDAKTAFPSTEPSRPAPVIDDVERPKLKYLGKKGKADGPTAEELKEKSDRQDIFWAALECLEGLSQPREGDEGCVGSWDEWLREPDAVAVLVYPQRGAESIRRCVTLLTSLTRCDPDVMENDHRSQLF
ncbi:hypothetical protein BT69DRAFT_437810 [Atractiella rhizophila]|nr:hypothetical protein BT69DRAFT_437810 [Atractiella rhizophila]